MAAASAAIFQRSGTRAGHGRWGDGTARSGDGAARWGDGSGLWGDGTGLNA
ncbi:hypothetical protein ACFU3J_34725 [Streptomyces sp. NPDC057411]|uniref:hypothetical protein n=1 Tax=unclassified Streptomyces TaxID=2593676 RepID=UPI00363894E1